MKRDVQKRNLVGPGSLLILVLFLAAASGCKNITPDATVSQLQGQPPTEMRYAAGDEIEVKFFYNPELNELQVIRPDGKITLQLVGDIVAAGKTSDKLREEIITLYEEQLRDPAVVIIARQLYTRRIFIGGAVQSPGVVEMLGSMTALEAIMQAGGFDTFSADKQQVIVIRNQNGETIGCKLNFKDALDGKLDQAFHLEPQDIVYVPTTGIADANRWVEQHINRLLPRFGLSYGADGQWYMSR